MLEQLDLTQLIFGRLSWDAIPLHEPVIVATFVVVAIGGVALLGALTYYRVWGYLWKEWFTSIDHKKIGIMYMVLGLVMLLRGFADAIMMRIQQAWAFGDATGYLPPDHYDQIFTAHGVIMIFFVAMPLITGIMNYIIPLQIGARDVAFPFLNNFSFWMTASGAALGRGLLEQAETAAGLVPKPKPSKSVPFDAPGFALSNPIVRGFNALYYRRVPRRGRTVVKPINDFFFPLDRIHDWNRLYGKRGFHQFQCVVPLGATEALRDILVRISASGLASPLAVLKRMGPGRAGHLGFPMQGYTLAADLRARPEAEALIARLTDMTADAGGRIYFAKDALCRPDRVPQMYPELDAWRAVVARADPTGAMATDLVRRLNLRDLP